MWPNIIHLLFICSLSIRNIVPLPENCYFYRGSLSGGIHLDGVKCVKADVSEIQSDLFPRHINYLEMVEGFMWSLTFSSFANYPKLEYLLLKSDAVHYIEENTFSSLTKLVYLDLSDNAITVLPPLPLSIETLYLNKMSMGEVLFDSKQTINAITSLKASLRKLSIKGNGLRSWPPFLKELPYLTEIDMDKNFIEELNVNDIAYICDLKVLVLSDNKIRPTEKYVCQCRHLQKYGLTKKVFINITCPSISNLDDDKCDVQFPQDRKSQDTAYSQCQNLTRTRKYWLYCVVGLTAFAVLVVYYYFCWRRTKRPEYVDRFFSENEALPRIAEETTAEEEVTTEQEIVSEETLAKERIIALNKVVANEKVLSKEISV